MGGNSKMKIPHNPILYWLKWTFYRPVERLYIKYILEKLLKKVYWISFIGYGILNPKYYGCQGGRMEIHVADRQYALEEIGYLTYRTDALNEFIDKWDWRYVNQQELNYLIDELNTVYSHDEVEKYLNDYEFDNAELKLWNDAENPVHDDIIVGCESNIKTGSKPGEMSCIVGKPQL